MTFCSILNGTLTSQTYHGTVSNLKRNNNGQQVNYEIINPLGFENTIPENYKDFIAYTLSDGSIVAFDPNAKGCEIPIGIPMTQNVIIQHSYCFGFIDVNGVTLPNREVNCGSGQYGTASMKVNKPCIVKNDANHMTDIFPVIFHDSVVEPASDAAKYILTNTANQKLPY